MHIDLPIIKMLETIAIIISIVLIRYSSSRLINRIRGHFKLDERRRTLLSKMIFIISNSIGILLIIGIWGVNQEDLALYLASILTVIGVAFFAQWSHLSNITAGIILYFNHPVRIGDKITIEERDFTLFGKVQDIGLFFVTVINEEKRKVLISNSNFVQKMVSISKTDGSRIVLEDELLKPE